MWTAPDVRRVLPIKSRVHRYLCLQSKIQLQRLT